MAAQEAQVKLEVLPAQQLTSPEDYQFAGDNSTVENKCRFLDAFRTEGSIYHAALAVGIHRTTVYKWLERDPVFATALDDSREDNYDQAETSVFKKALAGDSLLLMFYLKAHRHKFRDKVTIDVEVVRNEIEERMNQLNLRQLPAMTTEFLGSESFNPLPEPDAHMHVWSQGKCLRCPAIDPELQQVGRFADQPDQLQKESSE